MTRLKGEIVVTIKDLGPIVSLGIPLVLTNCTAALMQLTDAWLLGQLGPHELAAVTPAGVFVSLLLVFGGECLTTVNTFASHAVGGGEPKEAGNYAWQGVYLAFLLGLVSLVLLPAGQWMFPAIYPQASKEVHVLQALYFQIGLFSVLPHLAATALSGFFLAIKQPAIPLRAAVLGLVANVFLSYGLIHGKFGLPHLGFAGAAWGTVAAASIQAVYLVWNFLGTKSLRRLWGTTHGRLAQGRMLKMLQVGLPSGAQGCVDLFSWGVLLSWLIGRFGDLHLAAATALLVCVRLSFLPAEGIAAALTTLVGNAQGERNFLLARRLTKAAFRLIASFMIAMGVFYFVFRRYIMSAFTAEPEVIAIGMESMIFVCAFQYFDAMNVTYINALQGAGDTAWPTVMQFVLSMIFLLGGGLIIVNYWPELKSTGVWAMAALYIFFQGSSFRLRWALSSWRRIKLMD